MFKKGFVRQAALSGYADAYHGMIGGRRMTVYVKRSRAITLAWFANDALKWAAEQGVTDVYGWDATEPENRTGGFYSLLQNGTYEVIEDEREWQKIRDFVDLCERHAA